MSRFRLAFATCLGLLLAPLPALAQWSAAYETEPADSDAISDGAGEIRDVKAKVRARIGAEHDFDTISTGNSGDETGRHLEGAARAFFESSAPSQLNGQDADSSQSLDDGRIWFDSDDNNQCYVYDETAGAWETCSASSASNRNLLYNGSFEAGTAAGTNPDGWSDIGSPTNGISDLSNSSEGDGVAATVLATGSSNEGIQQTVGGLKISTVYSVGVRANPSIGDCDLQVTGGTATVTDTSGTATSAYETLTVNVTTNGSAGDLTVRLEANDPSDSCAFDHAWMYEQTNLIPTAGPLEGSGSGRDNTTTDDALDVNNGWVDSGMAMSLRAQEDHTLFVVNGKLFAEFEDNSMMFEAELQENCNGSGASTVDSYATIADSHETNDNEHVDTAVLYYQDRKSEGDDCDYTIRARMQGGAGDTADLGCDSDGLNCPNQDRHHLYGLSIPPR